MRQGHSFFITILLFFTIMSCDEKIEPGNTERSPSVVSVVSLAEAQLIDQSIIYEAVGTVTAGISSNISSKLMGVIEDFRVSEGDRVKKGDVLVVIDPRQVTAGEQKAEAALAEAKDALKASISAREGAQSSKDLAYATYQRYLPLKKDGMVSLQAFEEMEARHRNAEAELRKAEAMVAAANERIKQAESALSEASVARKDAVVRAPHAEIITGKMVDKGDLASPGRSLLTLVIKQ